MLKRGERVLIDTNAIGDAHAAKGWNALRQAFKLVTVPECVAEATRPNRAGLVLVEKPAAVLAAELEVIPVDDAMRFRLLEELNNEVALDAGERDLLALALREGRSIWRLCGPDKATLRAMHRIKRLDRMVSLEELLQLAGASIRNLDHNETKAWLSAKRTKLELGDDFI